MIINCSMMRLFCLCCLVFLCLSWSRLKSNLPKLAADSLVSLRQHNREVYKKNTFSCLFLQGCWKHRAVQRDGLHSERAVQSALGPSAAAAQTPALDRSQRGGTSLLQLGLQAA